MKRLLTIVAAAAISCLCQTTKAAPLCDVEGCTIGDYTWTFEVTTPGYTYYDEVEQKEMFVKTGEPYAIITGVCYDPSVVEEPFLDIPEEVEDEEGVYPVKAIGEEAFLGRKDITGVFIPSSVESIGYEAFSFCKLMTSLEFGEPETYEDGDYSYFDHELDIEESAFRGCVSLDFVELPANLYFLGEYAFLGCLNLESVVFAADADVQEWYLSVGEYAFRGCTRLESVEFEDWPEDFDTEEVYANIEIGEEAFKDCHALTDLYLGEGVSSISRSAFERDILIESVEFPSTVEWIGEYAFCDCASLDDVDMSACSGTAEIAANAFEGTPYDGSTGVRFNIDGGTLYGCKGILPAPFDPVDLVIPNEVTGIDDMAFFCLEGIASVRIPVTVEYIGDSAFEDCPDLKSVVFEGTDSNIGLSIGYRAFADCENLATVTFLDRPWESETDPESGTTYRYLTGGDYSIDREAFYNCQNLADLTFGVGLYSVGESAFQFCVSLESVSFPWTLSELYDLSFGYCSSLAEVTFDPEPDSEVEIAETAFLGTLYDGSVGPRLLIEDNTVYGIEGIPPDSEEPLELEIPEGIERIEDEAFWGLENLVSVSFPASLSYIGSYAFAECYNLEEINFAVPELVVDGDDKYFACELQIGDDAFESCESLTSLYIPPHTTYVGEYAFYACTSLEEVYFEADDSVEYGELDIGEYAFADCDSLEVVCFEDHPYGVDDSDCEERWCGFAVCIGNDAFYNCPALCDLTLGIGVCTIGESAFEYCTSLESVVFPWTVEEIGSRAFGDCESLEDVWFEGNEDYIDIATDAFEGAPWVPRAYRLEIDDEGVLWSCEVKEDVDDIYVEIPDDVVCIAQEAFYGIDTISGVFIPLSVERIESGAFAYCGILEDVEFEGDIDGVYVGPGAFRETPFNEDQDFALTIYGGVVTGFLGLDVPEELVIPDGVVGIGESAFDWDFSSMEVRDETDEIVDFSPVENITSIYIPESVEQIDRYAFYGCENAVSVTIDNPYVEIEGMAFAECEKLSEFVIENPGMAMIGMTLTCYEGCSDTCEIDSGIDGGCGALPAGGSVTLDPDFTLLSYGVPSGEYGNVWVTFEWGIIAHVDFDPTGSGETVDRELVVGQPYGDFLDGFEPEITRHGQAFAGWLVNGVPLTPDMLVGENDVITAAWKELDYNPLYPAETEEADTAVANIYDGYILDKSGASVGSIQVKVGKENANTHLASVSATIQALGQKKLSGFKAKDGGKVNFSGDTLSTAITLSKAGQTDVVLYVGKDGLNGTWGEYTIAGCRNTSKKSAADYQPWLGVYNVVFATDSASGDGAAFASGYSFLSAAVQAKGKVKVSGMMADGVKVNGSGQLLIGEGDLEACVSVFAPMYTGKSGGLAFVLWISKDGAISVESVSEWKSTNAKSPFTAKLRFVEASSLAAPSADLKFKLDSTSIPASIGGMTVLSKFLPTGISAKLAGTKFAIAKANKVSIDKASGEAVVTGDTDNNAALKLGYTAKSGAMKGSFTIYTQGGAKLKKVKAAVTGGFIGNSGYGTAVIKGVGSFPVVLEVAE